MILAKENAALSVCLEAAPPVAPSNPSADARAARLAKFKREQRIVEYLNRGVSIVEIAAQVGVGEKRMRAIVREIMDRRMPHPPREFVAIQVSRLNEALLVAYSAMSLTNLKAVDQVVKIVRELDRYHGFASVARRVPEAPRSEALVDGTEAYGAALVCQARYEPQDFDDMDFDSAALPLEEGRPGAFAGDDRPKNPPQAFAKTESAPGNPEALLPLSPRSPGQEPGEAEGWGEGPGRLAAVEAHPAPHPDLLPAGGENGRPGASAGDDRPENPQQAIEKNDSAPGIAVVSEAAKAEDDDASSANRVGHCEDPRTLIRGTKQSRGRRAPYDPLDCFVPPGSSTRGSLSMTGMGRLRRSKFRR